MALCSFLFFLKDLAPFFFFPIFFGSVLAWPYKERKIYLSFRSAYSQLCCQRTSQVPPATVWIFLSMLATEFSLALWFCTAWVTYMFFSPVSFFFHLCLLVLITSIVFSCSNYLFFSHRTFHLLYFAIQFLPRGIHLYIFHKLKH